MKKISGNICICLLVIGLSLGVYWQIGDHAPINADDFYLTANKHINDGFTYQSFLEGMSSLVAGVWMPLTYTLVGVEAELFGTDFGDYHLLSAFLHAANAALLFLLLLTMTGAVWRSALVACLFAVHPLNVEPVAWLVGIRVILCGFFCLLTLYFYARYTARRSTVYFSLALFCYVASLFAVPMFLPLPFLLLLLDFWPLGGMCIKNQESSPLKPSLPAIKKSIWEKFPFFGVMITLMTILLLSHNLPATPIEQYPLNERIFNALFSYVRYIGQFLVPTRLAVFYPFPGSFPWWKVATAAAVLVFVTALAIQQARRRPFFFVGWFWFAGMLFPLSGIAQIGSQARADHYMYLPMIGLLIIVCWGIPGLLRRLRMPRAVFVPVAATIILLLAGLSWQQAGHWKNSITLFTHVLKVTDNNYEAHNYLGQALAARGYSESALLHFQQALTIKPNHQKSNINIANTYIQRGELPKAIRHLRRAARATPRNARLQNNLGALYEKAGALETARFHYRRAITLDPGYASAFANLAGLEAATGNPTEAIPWFEKALEIQPGNAVFHFQLGWVFYQTGHGQKARQHLRRALEIEPDNSRYRQVLRSLFPNQSLQAGESKCGSP